MFRKLFKNSSKTETKSVKPQSSEKEDNNSSSTNSTLSTTLVNAMRSFDAAFSPNKPSEKEQDTKINSAIKGLDELFNDIAQRIIDLQSPIVEKTVLKIQSKVSIFDVFFVQIDKKIIESFKQIKDEKSLEEYNRKIEAIKKQIDPIKEQVQKEAKVFKEEENNNYEKIMLHSLKCVKAILDLCQNMATLKSHLLKINQLLCDNASSELIKEDLIKIITDFAVTISNGEKNLNIILRMIGSIPEKDKARPQWEKLGAALRNEGEGRSLILAETIDKLTAISDNIKPDSQIENILTQLKDAMKIQEAPLNEAKSENKEVENKEEKAQKKEKKWDVSSDSSDSSDSKKKLIKIKHRSKRQQERERRKLIPKILLTTSTSAAVSVTDTLAVPATWIAAPAKLVNVTASLTVAATSLTGTVDSTNASDSKEFTTAAGEMRKLIAKLPRVEETQQQDPEREAELARAKDALEQGERARKNKESKRSIIELKSALRTLNEQIKKQEQEKNSLIKEYESLTNEKITVQKQQIRTNSVNKDATVAETISTLIDLETARDAIDQEQGCSTAGEKAEISTNDTQSDAFADEIAKVLLEENQEKLTLLQQNLSRTEKGLNLLYAEREKIIARIKEKNVAQTTVAPNATVVPNQTAAAPEVKKSTLGNILKSIGRWIASGFRALFSQATPPAPAVSRRNPAVHESTTTIEGTLNKPVKSQPASSSVTPKAASRRHTKEKAASREPSLHGAVGSSTKQLARAGVFSPAKASSEEPRWSSSYVPPLERKPKPKTDFYYPKF